MLFAFGSPLFSAEESPAPENLSGFVRFFIEMKRENLIYRRENLWYNVKCKVGSLG